jgi:hypothetical protein
MRDAITPGDEQANDSDRHQQDQHGRTCFRLCHALALHAVPVYGRDDRYDENGELTVDLFAPSLKAPAGTLRSLERGRDGYLWSRST